MPIAALWPLPPRVTATAPVAPLYSEDDFLAALQNLMPPGRAWPRDAEAVQTKLLRGVAKTAAAAHVWQSALLDDAFPTTAAGLLPEWEETLGLPDPCIGEPAAMAARRALVKARLTARGGPSTSSGEGSQSRGQLTFVAATLGFTIGIEEFTDAAAGQAVCGQPLYGAAPLWPTQWARAGDSVGEGLAGWDGFVPPGDWAFALRIHATAGGAVAAAAGLAVAGDPIADWEFAALTSETYAVAGDPGPGTPLASWGVRILECSLRKWAPAECCLIFAYQ